MQPPDYFHKIERNALARWNQLEGDPELAGPWHQLFSQVQSPPHVLSELLQNADDAGAQKAVATIANGEFRFEHDGADFDAEQFGSLCRFAFSNKRTIHTIGFRGVGFKSTFSLADEVEVRTPTLAVRFHRTRFTLPVWISDAPPASTTVIRIRITDPHRLGELEQSLRQWAASAASLLFFRNLKRLEINGRAITKRNLGAGPVNGSVLWALTHVQSNGLDETDELLVFESEPEPFPSAAIDEIRRERSVADMHLPPCRVEVVLGLSGQQKAYVVLPTGAILDLPFSINAPFLQDPARFGIKEPSTSPTNRWLLDRAGRMAADILVNWVARQDLSLNERADAYRLLPKPDIFPDNANGRVAALVRKALILSAETQPVVLLPDGRLAVPRSFFCLPDALYSVWSETQLVKLFGGGMKNLLSVSVASEHRTKLTALGWLKSCSPTEIMATLLEESVCPPKPATWPQLSALWAFVGAHTNRFDGRPKLVKLVPVAGSEELQAASQTIRLPTRSDRLRPADWQFVMNYAPTIDADWLEWLTQNKRTKTDIRDKGDPVTVMLSELGFDQATAVDAIVAQASRRFFAKQSAPLNDCVRFARILAALGARVPPDFKFVTCDDAIRSVTDLIVYDPAGDVRDIAPARWCEKHILHDAYVRKFSSCTAQQWETWTKSGFSGILLSLPIVEKKIQGKIPFEQTLRERGISAAPQYPFSTSQVVFHDWGFEAEILHHWNTALGLKADLWAQVLKNILNGSSEELKDKFGTEARHYRGTSYKRIECGIVPPEWTVLLRGKSCLPDTRGTLSQPIELLLRTPDTEALRDIEPFLDADFDTPENRRLLESLGARTSASSPARVLERLEALAHASHPLRLVVEINRLYEALDRIISRCAPPDLKSLADAFSKRALILSESGAWVSSGEISIFSDEDKVAPAIHHAYQRLPMWPRLGVAEKPAFERSLGWLQSLSSGGRIDATFSTRVRFILQREPRRIWNECKHWLSLDQTWEPITRLANAQTMQNLGRWEGLAPAVKRATADLRMLPEMVCQQPPFAELKDLQEMVEFRVTNVRSVAATADKPWLAALADGLCRVKFNDEERTGRVRSVARRLAETGWKAFSHLEVTPYVEGAPAGAPSFPRVLWQDVQLHVTSSFSGAKLHKDLADELSRPFGDRSVADAITACIERSADYVTEYLADQFELEERVEPKSRDAESAGKEESDHENHAITPPPADVADPKPLPAAQNPIAPSDTDGATADGGGPATGTAGDEPEAKTPPKPPAPQKPTLIELYAKQRGFFWFASKSRYTSADGRWIEKAQSPFNWQEHNADGTVATRIWVSDQRLITGIEVAAELWGLASREPSSTAIVINGDNNAPCFLSGQSLLRLKDEHKIVILPSRYRIVEAST